ncbi:MAG: agmatine deiminase family protein [Bacteroidetes bacterium]|nr:agmatine deiminase family protein [Bacteroidota bacterium]
MSAVSSVFGIKRLMAFLSFGFVTISVALGQVDDHRMSPAEQAAMPSYLQARTSTGITSPPVSPVRAPAEWEEIDALNITWTGYTAVLKEIVRFARLETKVIIVCADSLSVQSYLTNNGIPLTNIDFLVAPYNSIWCRDYGQWNIYTHDVDSLALIDWIYNRPRPKDDTVPSSIARNELLPMYQTIQAPYDLIHTGGNFMTDGFGTGFSSNLVLNENPSHTAAEIDTILAKFMGINRFVKMSTLPFDVIHHIDMHLKLLDEETLLVGEYPQGVADGPQIEANLQYILSNYNSIYGTPYKVVRIPMPPDAAGRYPNNNGDYRTYTNAVFVNKTILVPGYETRYDTTAQRIWEEAMPGYNVQFINCNSIITALGALHCITKEVATRDPLLISHQPLADTYDAQNPYPVDARIQHRSGITVAELYYRTDTLLPYQALPMTLSNALTHTWTASIPAQAPGTKIDYYVSAVANSGKAQVRPMPAPAGYWSFEVLQFVGTEPALLAESAMKPAFPNPSKGITCIPVAVGEEGHGQLELTDVVGRKVASIADGWMPAGEKNYFIDTQNLVAGVYLLVFETAGRRHVQRLMVR